MRALAAELLPDCSHEWSEGPSRCSHSRTSKKRKPPFSAAARLARAASLERRRARTAPLSTARLSCELNELRADSASTTHPPSSHLFSPPDPLDPLGPRRPRSDLDARVDRRNVERERLVALAVGRDEPGVADRLRELVRLLPALDRLDEVLRGVEEGGRVREGKRAEGACRRGRKGAKGERRRKGRVSGLSSRRGPTCEGALPQRTEGLRRRESEDREV